jgi:hypothetical protein
MKKLSFPVGGRCTDPINRVCTLTNATKSDLVGVSAPIEVFRPSHFNLQLSCCVKEISMPI